MTRRAFFPSKSKKNISFALTLLLVCDACRKPPETPLPKTYPVTGLIVDQQGKPLTMGSIQFESMVDVKTQALGKVQPDGYFTMTTVVGEAMVPGAIEGPHKVSFLPVGRDQLPAYFDAQFKVGPGENNI